MGTHRSHHSKKIHKDMFDETWHWAGRYRKTMKNIGVLPEQISEEMKKACDDLAYWTEHKTYEPNEIAVRFHHRLVSIHPFPNGNGRFSRIVADIYLRSCGFSPLFWGGSDLNADGTGRKNYLSALRKADKGDISELLKVAIKK